MRAHSTVAALVRPGFPHASILLLLLLLLEPAARTQVGKAKL